MLSIVAVSTANTEVCRVTVGDNLHTRHSIPELSFLRFFAIAAQSLSNLFHFPLIIVY